MSNEKETQIAKVIGALGTLERATEFQTFLLLANFAIALNTTLTLTHRGNLIDLSWNYAKSEVPIGAALVFLAGFALYMSCIVGVVRYFADIGVGYASIHINHHIIKKIFPFDEKVEFQRPRNYVLRRELLDAARLGEDDSYLKLYHDHQTKQKESDKNIWRTASLSLAVLLLLLTETTLLPPSASLSSNMISFLNSACPNLGNLVAVITLFVLLSSWLYRFFEDSRSAIWVLCPKLYQKLEQERKNSENGHPTRQGGQKVKPKKS